MHLLHVLPLFSPQHTPVRHLSPRPFVQVANNFHMAEPFRASQLGCHARKGPGCPAVGSFSSWDTGQGPGVARDPEPVTFVPEQPCVFPWGPHQQWCFLCVL